jgi:SWI/SNF-related matrix-associated actin-dependent regulator 1 of chromatin subfamily A
LSFTTATALRPYQTDGATWIYNKLSQPDTRAVLLCDEPGLGKTVQALTAARRLNARRVLVVAPAGARRVWAMEITRWFPDWTGRIVIVEPGIPPVKLLPLLDRQDVIVLVSYDVLSQTPPTMAQALTGRRWDLLILDEAHYLKNPSNRTLAVYGRKGASEGLHASCERVLLLTGTPTPNHAAELWFHIRALWPSVLLVPDRRPNTQKPWRQLSHVEFEEQVTDYKDTPWGRQIIRSKNQPWLRDRMRPFVLRRTKARVLPELPALQLQDIPLAVRDEVLDNHLTQEARELARRILATARDDDDILAALHRSPLDNGEPPLASLRRQLGEMKVAATVEWVAERLDCGIAKIILFGWHLSVLEHLHRQLAQYDPVLITGATSPAGRQRAIDLFQNRPQVRVFVGQIQAAGTAITLTAASEVAIVEPSWVPGENVQAIDRAHRLGQHDSVLASFLFIPGTLDERIMSVFRRKARDIAKLHDDNPDDNETQGGRRLHGPGNPDLHRNRSAKRVRAVSQVD